MARSSARSRSSQVLLVALVSVAVLFTLLLKPSDVILPMEESMEMQDASSYSSNSSSSAKSSPSTSPISGADSGSPTSSLEPLLLAPTKDSSEEHSVSATQDTAPQLADTSFPNIHEQIRQEHEKSYAVVKTKSINSDNNKTSNNGMGGYEFEGHKSKICLTQACFEDIAATMARAFPDLPNKGQWCFPEANTTTISSGEKRESNDTADIDPDHHGLMLVKMPKAASSTMAGIVLRLGHRHNCNMKYIHWSHIAANVKYAQRDPQKSVIIMSVRHPASQLLSHVFWSYISLHNRTKEQISDEWLLNRVMKFGTTKESFRSGQGGE